MGDKLILVGTIRKAPDLSGGVLFMVDEIIAR
jgi:hypothetical protein